MSANKNTAESRANRADVRRIRARQAYIWKCLNERNRLRVDALRIHFNVTLQTARNDVARFMREHPGVIVRERLAPTEYVSTPEWRD